MNKRDYLSTGQAARLLNISRSSVARKFDLGALHGRVNPVTGERTISRSSVVQLMERHGLPVAGVEGGAKAVLLAALPAGAATAVKEALAVNARLHVREVETGADALLTCAMEKTDLLVVGDPMPDIDAGEMIRSLRRRPEHHALKVLCCARDASRERASAIGADEVVTAEQWAARDLLRGKIFAMLDLPAEVEDDEAAFAHRRRWPRYGVNLKASVTIYRVSSPRAHSAGRAVVRNISEGGAYLAPVEIEAGSFPAEPFRLKLDIEGLALQGVEAMCKVVRLLSNGSLTAGVQFIKIAAADRAKIAALRTSLAGV